MRQGAISAIAIALMTVSFGSAAISRAAEDTRRPSLAELWVDPGNTPRDLFWGSGGRKHAPPPGARYSLAAADDAGFSVSYDVTSPDGIEWSAKIGPEAQTEVVVSRILWGLGYHQPPLYYLPSWTLDRGREGTRRESEARFRPKLANLDRTGAWKWTENPFTDRRELRGLLVVLLMLNSTDLKDENNTIYEVKDSPGGVGRWFVVRDLGAALGETGKLYPRRNWLEGFERSGFITAVSKDTVEFDYDGRHRTLISTIQPGDVKWAAQRMRRITKRQWQDAFRAGNYAPPIAARYIALIEKRIADGIALRPDTRGGN